MEEEFAGSMFDIGEWNIDVTKLTAISRVRKIEAGQQIKVGDVQLVAEQSEAFYFVVIEDRVRHCSKLFYEENEATNMIRDIKVLHEEVAGMER